MNSRANPRSVSSIALYIVESVDSRKNPWEIPDEAAL
jgi:hypothetical protein